LAFGWPSALPIEELPIGHAGAVDNLLTTRVEKRGPAQVTDDEVDPGDDPDVIAVHESNAALGGPMPFRVGRFGAGVPLVRPTKSTPLEDDQPDGAIPAAPLWAMKYRRHFRFSRRADDEVRVCLGTGDGAIYAIDDGRKRMMISRQVGTSPDGCQYCLVGTLTISAYEQYTLGGASLDEMFTDGSDLALCAVFDAGGDVSNVSLVEDFGTVDDVPEDYLPPHAPIVFEENPDDGG
jgi:hypothetical protein